MELVDVHCHLDHPRIVEDIAGVVDRAREAGVKAALAQGVNQVSNERVLALARRYPLVKAALGLYPCDAVNVSLKDEYAREYVRESDSSVDETLAHIRAHRDEIVAIGEVGMDFQESDDTQAQEENFKKVIALAKEVEKPLIIHTRKAEEEVLDLLEESGISKRLVLLHCFCGKKRLVKRARDLGYSFSIPCSVTRAQNFQIIVDLVPLSQLFTETDAPYMPYDKTLDHSEPAHVRNTIGEIARIKGLDAEEVARNLFMNYQRMFL